MKKLLKNRWLLIAVVVIALIFIGYNTNWFGTKKVAATSPSTKKITDAYSDLTPDQMLELDKFRTELAKA